MADKMMRMAGRGEDGTAKGLRLNNDGVLFSHITNDQLNVSETQAVDFLGEVIKNTNEGQEVYGLEQLFTVKPSPRYTGDTNSWSPLISCVSVDKSIYVSNSTGDIIKLDTNGTEIWRKKYDSLNMITSLEADLDGNIYIGGSNATAQNGKLLKVDKNGEVVWTYTTPNQSGFSGVISVKLLGGFVYLATRHKYIIKINQQSASTVFPPVVVWTYQSTQANNLFQIDVDTSGNVYVLAVDFTNTIIKLDQSIANASFPPTVSWTYSSINGTIKNIMVYENLLVIQMTDYIKKLSLVNGAEVAVLMDVDIKDVTARSMLGSNKHFYISTSAKLLKINLDTLKVVFKLDLKGKMASTITEKDSFLYKYNLDGTFQKISSDLKLKGQIIKNLPINIPMNRNSELEVFDVYNGYNPVCMLDNHILAEKGLKYYVFENGWTSDPTPINFIPFLPVGTKPTWALFTKERVGYWDYTYRLLFYYNGILYHNYAGGGGIDNWAESNVWGLPETLHPTDTTTKTYKGRIRPKYYRPSTASDWYAFLGGSQYMRSSTVDDYNYSDSLWFGTYSQTATPASVFQTYDGIDIYVEYQYGVNPILARIGININTSQLQGSLPTDIKLRKRTSNIPNNTNKDPVDVFTYGSEIGVSAIVVDGARTKVTANSHGLSSGDIIHFKSASVTDNKNNWIKPILYADILNNSADSKWTSPTAPPSGNGKIYQVVKIDNNNFYLHEAVGNPHNHLYCTHIHSLDIVPTGIVVTTGEAEETSNFTFLHANSKLPPNQQMIQGEFAQLHLTANPTRDISGSIQRGLGFYMEEDWFIFASDEQIYNRDVELPEGRLNALSFESSGVFKGKLSQLDDWSSVKRVLQPDFVTFMFKKVGDIFITCDVGGVTYYSTDKGDTWKTLYTFNNYIYRYSGSNVDETEFIISGHYFRLNK